MSHLINKIILAALVIFLAHTPLSCKASRVFPGEVLILQSLQKGPVTPPGGSGCTFIPGNGGSGCPVKEMNVAGRALPRPTAYPHLSVPFGIATKQ